MPLKVFYSWQSELPNRTNRSFIRDALNDALASLHSDGTVDERPDIDVDTQGVPGSPDIVNAIFKKIRETDIFVADISITNRVASIEHTEVVQMLDANNQIGRPAPNSNVLVELGFALNAIGDERVILVRNTHYSTAPLPFDLGFKRAMLYAQDPAVNERATGRRDLSKRLLEAVKGIVGHIHARQEEKKTGHAVSKALEVKEWHKQRAELIASGKGFHPGGPHAHVVIHAVPAQWEQHREVLDVGAYGDTSPIHPMGSSSWGGEHNAQGYLAKSVESNVSYVQIYRDAILESVREIGTDWNGLHVIPATSTELKIIEHIGELAEFFKKEKLAGNIMILISIVKGHNAKLGIQQNELSKNEIGDFILTLPAVNVESAPDKDTILAALKAPFDRLWQAAGQAGSARYRR